MLEIATRPLSRMQPQPQPHSQQQDISETMKTTVDISAQATTTTTTTSLAAECEASISACIQLISSLKEEESLLRGALNEPNIMPWIDRLPPSSLVRLLIESQRELCEALFSCAVSLSRLNAVGGSRLFSQYITSGFLIDLYEAHIAKGLSCTATSIRTSIATSTPYALTLNAVRIDDLPSSFNMKYLLLLHQQRALMNDILSAFTEKLGEKGEHDSEPREIFLRFISVASVLYSLQQAFGQCVVVTKHSHEFIKRSLNSKSHDTKANQ